MDDMFLLDRTLNSLLKNGEEGKEKRILELEDVLRKIQRLHHKTDIELALCPNPVCQLISKALPYG